MDWALFLRELGIPLAGLAGFFILEARAKLSESGFVVFLIASLGLIFLVRYHPGEMVLFLLGLLVGAAIEISLRRLGYQQRWRNAHLMGVPYWLPLAWGVGFVAITRIGVLIRSLSGST